MYNISIAVLVFPPRRHTHWTDFRNEIIKTNENLINVIEVIGCVGVKFAEICFVVVSGDYRLNIANNELKAKTKITSNDNRFTINDVK